MADATASPRAPQTPPQQGASGDHGFADSAITDMTTPTISPPSKPQFGSQQSESELDTPRDQAVDDVSERLGPSDRLAVSSNEHKFLDQPSATVNGHSDATESTKHPPSKFDPEEILPASDAGSEFEPEADPELISHLSTTVSSLRLRHQEQSHLQSLFTSKLEALAQRSLEYEASIRSLTAELQSLRNSNTQLGRDNAILTQENNDLRISMQDLKGEVVEHETAMEAMTGAVRGLEGWIESANNSPRSNSQGRLLQDMTRHSRGRRETVRGKGRFRGRYYLDDDEATDINGGLGMDGSTDVDTTEIQEGVMAWVRGFKDVEEGLKARNETDGKERGARKINGRQHRGQNNDPTNTFDEEFGDFETG